MIHTLANLLLPLLVAIPAEEPGLSSPVGRLTPMDVFELEHAQDPQISPDGQRVVYVRRSMNIKQDSGRARLWIVNVDGSGHRPLTASTDGVIESQPRWSPDGTRIAYVHGEAGDSEVHVRWLDDGASARVTQLPASPHGISWSPDGSQLGFAMFVKESDPSWLDLPSAPEGASWAPAPKLIEDVVYRTDGGGYVEHGHDHVFVVSAEGGSARQITTGSFDFSAPSWDATGETLYTSVNRRDDRDRVRDDTEIVEIDLATGEEIPRTDRRGPDGGPAASSVPGLIAYLGHDERMMSYQQPRLYVQHSNDTAAYEVAAGLDLPKSDPTWHQDGKTLYFLATERGDTSIRLLNAKRPELPPRTVATNVGGTSLGRPYDGGSFSMSDDGTIAYTYTTTDHPSDVAIMSRHGEFLRLTNLNGDLFANKALAQFEEITWLSSADGEEIQGWVAYPPEFDPSVKYPLLLEIHGGPHADYGPRFAAEIQLYAAAGYIVLYCNPRGSTSYGEAFANQIHHAYPGDDYFDLMSGVDVMIASGFVDEDRLFVTGGSGGGVLTAWIVGTTDRFRAAVVAKPVIDWTSFVLTADMYPHFASHWFPGPPWEHPTHYWERSPLSRVGNVKTPTMLLTGEEDYRTPISESEQFYQALKLREIETAMVRIPEAGHGITARPSNLMRKVSVILQWFARHDQKPAS